MARRAVVTGAAKRVGRCVALELARSGFDVAVHYHSSRAQADEVVRQCVELGVSAFSVQADLGQAEACQALCDTVSQRWDTLDLLVNNASLYEPEPFEQITVQSWERMLGVNLRAPFLLAQGLLPLLRASGAGLVVQFCDIGADRPFTGYTHYSISKAGAVMLVKSMAVELGPTVRAVGISPGHIAWPPEWSDATKDRMRARIPLGRVGEPEDAARLVRFLALEGTYINGAILPLDGGLACKY